MASSIANSVLTQSHVFGLSNGIRNNVAFMSENMVIYPCANCIVIYNPETKVQKFIPNSEDADSITALCISPNKKVLAIGEKGEKGPSISIWDLIKMQKRKVLTLSPEGLCNDYTCITFSADSKYLLAQGGEPEWTLVLWLWEKNKMICTTKTSIDANRPIFQADFNPTDSSVVAVTGDHCLKFFRIADNNFKPINIGLMKREVQMYKCHAWQGDGRIIVGTNAGDLLLFEFNGNYELKTSFSTGVPGVSVESLSTFTKGFIVGCDAGIINIFEKTEDVKEIFKCNKIFRIDGHESKVGCLAISPSEDTLACSTANNQLFVLSLSNTDILKPEDMNFETLSTAFHSPGKAGKPIITGLDICIRKPLIVTCGLDCTVRVWNYTDKSIDIMKSFPWEAHAVAFHPGGLQVAVGFTEKLQLLNLLMNDIRSFKEYPIKSCNEIHFARGGHLLAAANGQITFIINTYTCQILYQLRGHATTVSSIFFGFDDLNLYSAGLSGNICRWNLRTGDKIGDFIHKTFSWSSIVCSPESNAVYGIGELSSAAVLEQTKDEEGNTHIRARHAIMCVEFNSDGTPSVRSEIDAGVKVGCCTLSNSGKYLFVSTFIPNKPSAIRAYKVNPLLSNEYTEIVVHGCPITRMLLSLDDTTMFATSEDGSLSILNVKQEGRALKREKDIQFSEEILVTKSDLEEKQSMMHELVKHVDDLTMHNEYQLNLKDINYNDKIKEVTEKFTAELEQDRAKYETLKEERSEMVLQYTERIKDLNKRFTVEVGELEASHDIKIAAEMERYEGMVKDRDEMNVALEAKNAALLQSHENHIEEMILNFEKKIGEENSLREKLTNEKVEIQSDFDKAMVSHEVDADIEIEELKEKYIARLNIEKNFNLKLRGENMLMKKKHESDKKVVEVQQAEIEQLVQHEKDRHETIKTLEKDILGHMKEIREREETINDKEKRIYDLKKKNQELEKFKFVLDYKIKELRRQIEPRQNEITDMKAQIKEMDLELEQYHTSNASLDLMIGELKLKMEGMERESNKQDEDLEKGVGIITLFKESLMAAEMHLNDHKYLKPKIINIYKKFTNNASGGAGIEQNDSLEEQVRAREYLEKSVESLKKKIEKDAFSYATDHARLMRESAKLTNEINDLRRELHYVVSRGNEQEEEEVKDVNTPLTAIDGENQIQAQKNEIRKLKHEILLLTSASSTPQPPNNSKDNGKDNGIRPAQRPMQPQRKNFFVRG